MKNDKIKVPFFYTTNTFPYNDYDSAERFCKSLEARIPNYLELYHIVFNKFDTFGENYYWSCDKDGKKHLVLHFKNMSYEIMKRPDNVKPLLYCVADTKDEMGFEKKSYFYHNFEMEKNETLETYTDKNFNFEKLNDLLKKDRNEQKIIEQQEPKLLPFATEKKHVNFSVKEVTPEIFEDLINSGYYYNPAASISKDYETNDAVFSSIVRNNSDKIRLCFFPFTKYIGLNINQEKEIWQQSFCSPSFDLVNMAPVIKTQHEKDSYCIAYGGRVPNIPELNGILRAHGKNQINVKYWVNTKVKDPYTNTAMPVLVYYKDSRFLNVKAVSPSENEQAYTYCIKKSQNPSSVIANYKSRFPNVEGYIYAKQQCQNCYYYEVPDTVLMQ
ncbi:MAG: hypothetical protein LUH05_08340 [Candidatus Gastranaerophilales bacterium]|nr:hypothetical protein [Candidatus Gastranaerophilales bacterium]